MTSRGPVGPDNASVTESATAGVTVLPEADAPLPQRPRGRAGRALLLSALTAGVCIGLAGAGAWWALRPAVDARVASLCRTVIPALNPENAAFSIAAPRKGAFSDSVRIAYTAQTADGRLRRREITCRYAVDPDGAPQRLTGVATERGPLNEANFYFLRRFYLEASDGPPQDPATSQAVAPEKS